MRTVDEYLRECPVRIPANQTATVLFGTGLSKALSRSPAADWKGQIKELAGAARDPVLRQLLAPGAVLDSARAHHFTGLLHMIRRELDQRWSAVMTQCIQKVVDQKRGATQPGVAAWNQVLQRLGTLARSGVARVATTNFDDLAARRCGLKVMSREGEVFEPGDPSAQIRLLPSAGPLQARGGVTDNRMILNLWGNMERLEGKLSVSMLERTAGVLHLHGWYLRPDQLVVDPVEYHQTVVRALWSDLAAHMLISSLARKNTTTIFSGVGDGLYDDHFVNLLRLLIQEEHISAGGAAQNIWLLQETEARDRPAQMEAALRRVGIDRPLSSIIQVVSYGSDYGLAPVALGRILGACVVSPSATL
jgi:hypothetical protein